MKRVMIATLFIATIASAQEAPTDENPATETPSASDVNVKPTAEKIAAPAPKAAEPADETGSAAYRSKILELNGRVSDLKEKIFRTKTRLAILKENVLSKTIAGAEGRFYHVNNMGPSYVLEKDEYR